MGFSVRGAWLALAIGCAGLYLCTVFVNLIPAVIAAVSAIGGLGTLSWYFLSH